MVSSMTADTIEKLNSSKGKVSMMKIKVNDVQSSVFENPVASDIANDILTLTEDNNKLRKS